MIVEEFYGGAEFAAVGANIQLRRGVKVHSVQPTTSGLVAFLPDARKFPTTGVDLQVVINSSAVDTLAIHDFDGGVLLAAAPIVSVHKFSLSDNSTAAGVWHLSHSTPAIGFAIGALIPADRQLFDVILTEDESNVGIINKINAQGWDGVSVVRVYIKLLNNVTIGGGGATFNDIQVSSFVMNQLPAGSTCLLHITPGSSIRGAGGNGGSGGVCAATPPDDLAQAGEAGGHAILSDGVNLIIKNEGIIASGGGGGGGGGYDCDPGGSDGGGGGGGAGVVGGTGGGTGILRGVDGRRNASGGGAGQQHDEFGNLVGSSLPGDAGYGGTGGLRGEPGLPGLVGAAGQTSAPGAGGIAGKSLRHKATSQLFIVEIGIVLGEVELF